MADEKILKDKGLKDEKILKDELLSDEQLEQVAGGLGWNTLRNKDQIIAENSNQMSARIIPTLR